LAAINYKAIYYILMSTKRYSLNGKINIIFNSAPLKGEKNEKYI